MTQHHLIPSVYITCFLMISDAENVTIMSSGEILPSIECPKFTITWNCDKNFKQWCIVICKNYSNNYIMKQVIYNYTFHFRNIKIFLVFFNFTFLLQESHMSPLTQPICHIPNLMKRIKIYPLIYSDTYYSTYISNFPIVTSIWTFMTKF